MNIDEKIISRFEQLIETGKRVLQTRFNRSGEGFVYVGDDGVNRELSNEWGISCLNLLGRVFGHGRRSLQKLQFIVSQVP